MNIRIVNEEFVSCKVIAPKSMATFIGEQAIPRLELLSRLVLARLISHVQITLQERYDKILRQLW